MERSEEQALENERRFKEANEQIRARREQLTSIVGATPYLCECEEPRCTELIRLTLEEYAAARDGGERFVIAPGHTTRGQIVDQNERYMVVDKS